jgi:hypothetical protein
LTWARAGEEERDALRQELADHPEFLPILRGLCVPPAEGNVCTFPCKRTRGLAVLLLHRHFASHTPENAAALVQELEVDHHIIQHWMLEPDLKETSL